MYEDRSLRQVITSRPVRTLVVTSSVASIS